MGENDRKQRAGLTKGHILAHHHWNKQWSPLRLWSTDSLLFKDLITTGICWKGFADETRLNSLVVYLFFIFIISISLHLHLHFNSNWEMERKRKGERIRLILTAFAQAKNIIGIGNCTDFPPTQNDYQKCQIIKPLRGK